MRVLIVNYDFPPALSGVRRVVKLCKFLPESGIEPIVLCARPAAGAPLDRAALAEVEGWGIRVVRTASLDPAHVAAWLSGAGRREGTAEAAAVPDRARDSALLSSVAPGDPAHVGRLVFRPGGAVRLPPPHPPDDAVTLAAPSAGRSRGHGLGRALAALARRALVPDDRIGWLPFALAAARRLMRDTSIDAILTSGFPNTAHLVGLRLQHRHGLRWVADFRDGWTQNPYFGAGLTPVHGWANRRLEAAVARRADAVCAVSQPIADHLARLRGGPVECIPNGFDLDDTEGLVPYEFDRFTLAYTGTLFMQRGPGPLFHALRALADEHPGLADHFQVVFRTRFQPEHETLLRELRLGRMVRNWGLGSHHEALLLQHSAHALLVMEGDGPGSEIMLTQKVFEYLAAGKPILAIAPTRGALADLIRRTGTGRVTPPDDVFRIKERLWELFNGQSAFAPRVEEIARYTRRGQARSIAALLRGVPADGADGR